MVGVGRMKTKLLYSMMEKEILLLELYHSVKENVWNILPKTFINYFEFFLATILRWLLTKVWQSRILFKKKRIVIKKKTNKGCSKINNLCTVIGARNWQEFRTVWHANKALGQHCITRGKNNLDASRDWQQWQALGILFDQLISIMKCVFINVNS